MSNSKPVSDPLFVHLDKETHDRLRETARTSKRSKSSLVRDAIRNYLSSINKAEEN